MAEQSQKEKNSSDNKTEYRYAACYTCGTSAKPTKKCAGCSTGCPSYDYRYCSKACQRKAWRAGHKRFCGKRRILLPYPMETFAKLMIPVYVVKRPGGFKHLGVMCDV